MATGATGDDTGAFVDKTRAILRLSGPDVRGFLQDLVTNDVSRLDDGPVYAALLTPQGKYLADFIMLADGPEAVHLDVAAALVEALVQRLTLYRLRRRIEIVPVSLQVVVGLGPVPPGLVTYRDPRHPALGWRVATEDPAPILAAAGRLDPGRWHAIRVAEAVPEAGLELVPDESYILEAGFERLNGVDFRKGCFVGQEVVARMKHKTTLKKGLVRVRLEGTAPVGSEITAEGRVIGRLFSQADGWGLAQMRLDRMDKPAVAGDARILAAVPVAGQGRAPG